ncbi:hypothetical protein [Legionella spiritensis]|uniref:hypothetical protein n=1 Tax=Legionella spiritensis TaxID=452 RepID=UPI000F6DA7F2|nr:hypothetical protein [Legionella spiritensis]VEG92491.1 Uncharacterised protein [Legionella spiritensis]
MALFFDAREKTLEDKHALQCILQFTGSETFRVCQLVSKTWYDFTEDDPHWKEKGAKSRTDFFARVEELSPKLQPLVFSEVYDLSLAEDIQRLWKLDRQKRQQELLTAEQAGAMNTDVHLKLLLSDIGVQALREKLFTPEQTNAIYLPARLEVLLNDYGLAALRENHITLAQVQAMPCEGHLKQLLSPIGLAALREKLITAEQIIAMSKDFRLNLLLSDQGLQALRAGHATPELASAMSPKLLSDYIEVATRSSGPACS